MKTAFTIIAFLCGLSATGFAQNYANVEAGLQNCESCKGHKAVNFDPPLQFRMEDQAMHFEKPSQADEDNAALLPHRYATSHRQGELTDCSARDVVEGDINCAGRMTGKGVLIDHDDPCWSVSAKGAKELKFACTCGIAECSDHLFH